MKAAGRHTSCLIYSDVSPTLVPEVRLDPASAEKRVKLRHNGQYAKHMHTAQLLLQLAIAVKSAYITRIQKEAPSHPGGSAQ